MSDPCCNSSLDAAYETRRACDNLYIQLLGGAYHRH